MAVRIAKALSLHLEQPITSGSFFQRQMRNRLWCTICVLDLQASFHQASEPLIDLEVEHYALPRNINDADFDPSFPGADIPDKDELTDITFSLVTYKAQLSGRLLNFMGTTTSATRNSSPGHPATIWDDRLDQARRFEDQVYRLLSTCDPESSAYAWFTFHGTKSLISSMRLSALRPLNRAGLRAPPRVQGSSDLLTAALSVLSKAQLVRTDPRGEGFRWYVRVQWHALAIAIAECFVCSDEQLLASVWPVVEAAYDSTYTGNQQQQQRQRGGEATAADYYRQDGSLRQPLQALMTRTRARVKNFLRGASGSVVAKAPVISGGRGGWSSTGPRTPADPSTLQSPSVVSLTGIKEAAADAPTLSTSLDFGFWPTPAFTPSSNSPDKGMGSSASLGHGLGEAWSLTPAYSSSMTDNRLPSISVEDCMDLETMPDFSWQAWEELLSGIPPEGGLFDGSTGFY